MIFVPEAGAGIRDMNLANSFNEQERRAKRDNQELLPKEMEANVFLTMIGNTFAQPTRGRRFLEIVEMWDEPWKTGVRIQYFLYITIMRMPWRRMICLF